MNRRNRMWAAAAGTLLLSGCTTVRFYPVCVLDTGHVPPAMLWASARLQIEDVLEKAARGAPSARVEADGVLVVATPRDHNALSRAWPQYACHIAPDAGAGRDILVDDCRRSVNRYMSGQMAYWPVSAAAGAPSCAVARR